MPLCQVFTNVPVAAPASRDALLTGLSRILAARFDKPERWVMTCVLPDVAMMFGATAAPTAFVVVRNVGTMKPADTEALSEDLCAHIETVILVPRDRIYIEFGDGREHLWGWNGGTFA